MRDVIALVAAVLVAALLVSGCATTREPVPATHPASPRAPVGRLAGPPPSLRAGVVEYKDVPAVREGAPPPVHHHHGH